jgi:4-carboxymuconolactone decarboxylase
MGDYSERRKRGERMIEELGWKPGPDPVPKKVSPDFWEMTVGHLFGDVWSRPGLSLRERELVTMAAIITMARPMGITPHFRDIAPKLGITREEILEVITQVGHYAGWPAAVHAIFQLNEVIEDQGKKRKSKQKSVKR